MVWGLERVTRDPGHAWQLGQAGKRSESTSCSWGEVARRLKARGLVRIGERSDITPEVVETILRQAA